MIIYNVTTNIDESIHEEWMQWMQEEHIPEVLSTGKFVKALLSQVMVNEDMGGITYSIQYSCISKDLLDQYYRDDADRLRKQGLKKFGNKFGAFRTELQVIKEFIK